MICSSSSSYDRFDLLDSFHLSGPTHLADQPQFFSNPSFKRAILACLVKGLYVSVQDTQAKRRAALAPPWWRAFNYDRVEATADERGGAIVGAVYKWNSASKPRPSCAPGIVVAFRGALGTPRETFESDTETYRELLLNRLDVAPRFRTALRIVRDLVDESGAESLCLTGHSLGAAISLLAGRILAEEGVQVETYVFSPPYPSVPLELIEDETLQEALQVLRTLSAAGLACLRSEQIRREAMESFLRIRDWFPNLYVNASDPICSSYIGYFKSREWWAKKAGQRVIAELAAAHSSRLDLLQRSFVITESEALRPRHLLPSAHLHFIDRTSAREQPQVPKSWNVMEQLDWRWRRFHGLSQWWDNHLQIHYHHANLGFSPSSRDSQ